MTVRETVETLLASHLTCAAAESLTGGMVSSMIVDVPGASGTFLAGLVTYAPEMKTALAGVDSAIIATYGVVSEPCARAMALGAREKTGADIAVSTTGLAGPGGGTPETPVGTVFVGCAAQDGVAVKELHLSGTREEIRRAAALEAITLLGDEALKQQKKN